MFNSDYKLENVYVQHEHPTDWEKGELASVFLRSEFSINKEDKETYIRFSKSFKKDESEIAIFAVNYNDHNKEKPQMVMGVNVKYQDLFKALEILNPEVFAKMLNSRFILVSGDQIIVSHEIKKPRTIEEINEDLKKTVRVCLGKEKGSIESPYHIMKIKEGQRMIDEARECLGWEKI